MANIKSAKKRVKQSIRNNLLNSEQRSAMRTQVKKLIKLVAERNLDAAKTAFPRTASILDKAARKGLIHKNKAARLKSRLNKRVKGLAQAQA